MMFAVLEAGRAMSLEAARTIWVPIRGSRSSPSGESPTTARVLPGAAAVAAASTRSRGLHVAAGAYLGIVAENITSVSSEDITLVGS